MAQRNKTDQFFREKLDQLEFQPSGQAWEKVQGAIGSKATPWPVYLKIAAGFALLLAISLLFYPTDKNENYGYNSEVISPEPLELATIDTDALKKTGIGKTPDVVPDVKVSSIRKADTEPKKEITTTERIPLELKIIEEISVAEVTISSEKPDLNESADTPEVKITYFTARNTEEVATQEEDSVKTNLLDKMKFFAKNVSPVELLTDLRTAKEELLENGFRKN